MTSQLLTVKDLCVWYGTVQVVWDVCLEVKEGSVVALIGANGAGKTTILKSISGIVRKKNGRIELEGQAIGGMRPEEIVGLGIAHVPEGRRIFPQLSVEENLKVGAFRSRERRALRTVMDEMFEAFPRLRERRKQSGATLSGGEQQMLAFARALMAKPRMLLLDEPSLGLAPKIISEVGRQINQFRARGLTVMLVEQNANLALSIADYAYVLDLGRIVKQGKGRELLGDEDVRQAYLGAAASERVDIRVDGPV